MRTLNLYTVLKLFKANHSPIFIPTEECRESQVIMQDFYSPLLYIALIHYLFVCFFTERRSFLRGQIQQSNQKLTICERIKNYFKRYPGLPIPMNVLQYRHSTLAYVAVYICAFNLIAGIFTKHYGMAKVFPNAPIWLSIIYKLFAICLVALTTMPLFISVTHGGLLCWIIGLLYCTFQATLIITSLIRSTCMGFEYLTGKLSIQLPTLIGFTYLFVYFCEAIFSQRHNWRTVFWIGTPINFRIYIQKNVNHVKQLLWSRQMYQERVINARTVKVKCCGNLRTLCSGLENETDGFTYPAGLLWSLAVSVLLQYFLFTQFLTAVYGTVRTGKRSIGKQYPDVPKTMIDNLGVDNARRVHQFITTNETDPVVLHKMEYELLYYWIDVTWVCLLIATSLAMFTNVCNVLRIAFHYRQLCVTIYRCGFKVMPGLQSWLDAYKVTRGTIIYPSYQIAAMACGFYLQALIYTVIFIFLSFVVTRNAFTPYDFLVKWFKTWWPSLILMTLFAIVQQLAIRFLFTQQRGKSYGFNNIRSLQLYTFLSSFYNVFFGLFCGIGRVLYCPISSALVVSRLDVSPLARPIQSLDTGHLAFLGFLYMDILKNHPTFRVFLWILMGSRIPGSGDHFDSALLTEVNQFMRTNQKQQCMLSAKFHQQPRVENTNSDVELNSMMPKEPEILESSTQMLACRELRRRQIRNRWFVVYTLLRNPELAKYRKGCVEKEMGRRSSVIYAKLGTG